MSFFYSVLIILATSTLTTIFSFWRYRSEKWWELKVKTYSNIMESLHYIKKCNEMDCNNFDKMFNGPTDENGELLDSERLVVKIAGPEAIQLLHQKSGESFEEIEKIIDVSSFIILPEAIHELHKLKVQYSLPFDFDEIESRMEEDTKLISETLIKLSSIAKMDLQTLPDKVRDKFKKY